MHRGLLDGERRSRSASTPATRSSWRRSRRCPTRSTSACAAPPWRSSARSAWKVAATSSSRSRPTRVTMPSSRSTPASVARRRWPRRPPATPSPAWPPRSPSGGAWPRSPMPSRGTTVAAFEPALDYVVVKLPRFPFDKFPTADRRLGSQMKATGEVMAIDRTFGAALNKALRGLEQAGAGFLAEDPAWGPTLDYLAGPLSRFGERSHGASRERSALARGTARRGLRGRRGAHRRECHQRGPRRPAPRPGAVPGSVRLSALATAGAPPSGPACGRATAARPASRPGSWRRWSAWSTWRARSGRRVPSSVPGAPCPTLCSSRPSEPPSATATSHS